MNHLRLLSVAEIKAEMKKLPKGEIVFLAAYAKHLARQDEPGYGTGLDGDFQAMENGDKVSGTELRRLLGELDKAGL